MDTSDANHWPAVLKFLPIGQKWLADCFRCAVKPSSMLKISDHFVYDLFLFLLMQSWSYRPMHFSEFLFMAKIKALYPIDRLYTQCFIHFQVRSVTGMKLSALFSNSHKYFNSIEMFW